MSAYEGHRGRLREKFVNNPDNLSKVELFEILLTYAIPRRDVAPLAKDLIARFGDIDSIFTASFSDLQKVDGIGEQAAVLIKVIDFLLKDNSDKDRLTVEEECIQPKSEITQPKLFEVEPEMGPLFEEDQKPIEPQLRTFANDEIENVLRFIPEATNYESIETYKAYLEENLPYNSISTRQRRTSYIVNRYFPTGRVDTPITYFASNCSHEDDLKPVLFYETLKAEPIAAKIAEELVWPSLPRGYVNREEMREFILRYLPDLGSASQTKVLRSIYKIYSFLSIGVEQETLLRLQLHNGTLEGYLYILASEYPEPGIYSFESLFDGPIRYWLLWDKEWIRLQLYNLQDYGIITKISEIDTVRHFTLQFDQMNALRTYFEHPQRGSLTLREQKT